LNEDLDQVSVPYAAQVVRESILKSPLPGAWESRACRCTDLYSIDWRLYPRAGGEIQLRADVESFRTAGSEVQCDDKRTGTEIRLSGLAVPFDVLARLLPETPVGRATGRGAWPVLDIADHRHPSLVRSQISDLDHAVLLDRTIQWMFHKSRLIESRNGRGAKRNGSYIELVVSCSRSLVEKSKTEIVEMAVKEAQEFFPSARGAKLLKSTVIKEVHATYSPRPGIDQYRPQPETAWPRVFLAGDWTATGWPATMEGAVRSGYLAAEALSAVRGGKTASFLVPDLAPSGLMRLFG
jgi:hypothetical protein